MNIEYSKYPDYKKSDVQFIGSIPSHWETWKVTHGFQKIGSGTTPKSDNPDFYNGDIPWITTSELRETLITDTSQKITELALEKVSSLKIYKPGSIAIAMYGATIGRLGILGIESAVNQACCVYDEPTEFYPKFLYYWLWMSRNTLIAFSSGGGQPNLSQDDLKKLRIPIPNIAEQTLIARFLDQKTSQIDQLIEQKEKLLKLLAEKRTAIITQAVTKGLDPTVEMKDSGIDWLREIPKHWKTLKLRYLGRMKSGEGITTLGINEDNEYPVYGGNGFRGFASDFTHNGDFVLIGRQGALCGNINYASGKFWASEHAVVVTRAMNVDLIWLGELLRIMNLNQYSVSAAQPGLAIDRIQNLEVPLPTLSEQQAIAKYLQKMDSFSSVAIKIKSSISKLKEYREALITAAVTGQIDVRKENMDG